MRPYDNCDTNFPDGKLLKRLKINGYDKNKDLHTTENDTKRHEGGLQNHEIFLTISIDNQHKWYLQMPKSVNPAKKQNATQIIDLCAKVSHFVNKGKILPQPSPAGNIISVLAPLWLNNSWLLKKMFDLGSWKCKYSYLCRPF